MSRKQSGTQTVVCVPELFWLAWSAVCGCCIAGYPPPGEAWESWVTMLDCYGDGVRNSWTPSCWDGQAGDNQDHGRG